MAAKIHNPSSEPVTLPFPLTGVLKGGQSIVLTSLSTALLSLLLAPALQVSEVGDLAGDDDHYSPFSDGIPSELLADGSVGSNQLAAGAATASKLGGAVGDEAALGGLLGNMQVLRRNFAAGPRSSAPGR